MQDFINRMSDALNKRAVENFIKAGAFDTFGNKRRAMMLVADSMLDNAVKQKKDSMSGQMSLFDFTG